MKNAYNLPGDTIPDRNNTQINRETHFKHGRFSLKEFETFASPAYLKNTPEPSRERNWTLAVYKHYLMSSQALKLSNLLPR